MVFPYGILVDRHAERFVDEGRGTVDETYEATARAVWARDGAAGGEPPDRRRRTARCYDIAPRSVELRSYF